MIQPVLIFQFALLYIPILMIGLLVFGSDFKLGGGWLYIFALGLIVWLHWTRPFWSPRLSLAWFRLISLLGGSAGVAAYHPMHVGYWDEHSWPQAAWIASLGVASYIAAAWVAFRLNKSPSLTAMRPVLLMVAGCWGLATVYPMAPVLAVALILLLGAILIESPVIHPEIPVSAAASYYYRYATMLVVLDAFLVVWDYKVDTHWGIYLGLSMLSSGLALCLPQLKNRMLNLVYAITVLNFITAIVYPVYILSYGHSVVAGFAFGVLLRQLPLQTQNRAMQELLNVWGSILIGLWLGFSIYANLATAHWRGILLLPLLFPFFWPRLLGVIGRRIFTL